jgi:two-component system cell cycle response regulator DivK
MSKILIVEDNQNNMYLISYILKMKGYEIIQAETGEKGVELAIKEKPDLVLMDIQLPGIDGMETTKRIRASGADGNIPIIALTSYAMTGDKEKALKAGCTGYIEKPINPDTVLNEIEKYLKTGGTKNEHSRSR